MKIKEAWRERQSSAAVGARQAGASAAPVPKRDAHIAGQCLQRLEADGYHREAHGNDEVR